MFASNDSGISFKSGRAENADFSGRKTLRCNYRETQYIRCTLDRIDTRWSYLGGLVFKDCTLREADFEFALLNGSTVEGDRVSPTRFENCGVLTGTNFSNVDLTGVQFSGNTSLNGAFYNMYTTGLSDAQKSQMRDITLKKTDGSVHPMGSARKLTLSNIMKTAWVVDGPGGIGVRDIKVLEGLDLSHVNLRGLGFVNQSLAGAKLTGADLTATNLNGADMSNTTLDGATFGRNKNVLQVNLAGARILNTDLTGVDMKGSNLSGATIHNVHTDGNVYDPAGTSVITSFHSVNFAGATIRNSRFKFTIFSEANLANAAIADNVNNNVIPEPADANDSIQNAAALLSNDFKGVRCNNRTNWVLWMYRSVPQIAALINSKGIVDIGEANE
jgi:uncharacterized protein YjbI with pentapeptide repeats